MTFVVGLESRHIGVVDEFTQRGEGYALSALGDCQGLAVGVRVSQVLGGLGPGLIKRKYANAPQGGVLVAPPGDHVRLVPAGQYANKETWLHGVMHAICFRLGGKAAK